MSASILSSNQIHQLHHSFVEPTDDTKATLLIVHGMCEHGGRYAKFAQFLASQGIAVVTYDQLGHGKTVKSIEELGFIDEKHPMQALLKDVIIMANVLKTRHPDVPHFIMGHSMGSFIVRNLLKYHSSSFAGAILMGTADKNPMVKVLTLIFSRLNRTAPHQPANWAGAVMNNMLNAKLKSNKNSSDFAWLSQNLQNINHYESDPLCGFAFSNNGYYALFNLMDGALNKDWYSPIKAEYPLMFVSGQDDPIGDMGKGIDKLLNKLKKKGFNNLRKNLYPNMRHEPLNETDNQQVYDDISKWILDNT